MGGGGAAMEGAEDQSLEGMVLVPLDTELISVELRQYLGLTEAEVQAASRAALGLNSEGGSGSEVQGERDGGDGAAAHGGAVAQQQLRRLPPGAVAVAAAPVAAGNVGASRLGSGRVRSRS